MKANEIAAALLETAYRQPLRTAVYAALLLVSMTLVCLTPHYETNDDVGMHLTAAGVMLTDTPEEHLFFTNVLIGLGLKALYLRLPNWPWYAWYHVIGVFVAAVATIYAFLATSRSARGLVISALWLFLITLSSLLAIQFTKTAFYLGLAGWLLFASVILVEHKRPMVCIAMAGLLVVAGSLVRFDSFQMVCLLAWPSVGCTLLTVRRKTAWLRALGFAASTACTCYSLHWFDAYYYRRDPAWEHAFRYNALRSEFCGYQRVTWSRETDHVFREVGWRPIDFAMIQNWFFADPETYSEEKLRTILAGMKFADRNRAVRQWKALFGEMKHNWEFIAITAGGLACVLTMGRWRWLSAAPLLTLCVTVALCVVLYEYFHLPSRVYTCLFAAVLASACLVGGDPIAAVKREKTALRHPALQRLVLLPAFALAAFNVFDQVRKGAETAVAHAEVAEMLRELAPQDNQLYVLWAHFFPYERAVRPFDDLGFLRSFHCVSLGSGSHLPTFSRRLKRFGVDNLCRALYEKHNVLLLCIPYCAEFMTIYIRQHYGVDIEFEVADRFRGESIDICFFRGRLSEAESARGLVKPDH